MTQDKKQNPDLEKMLKDIKTMDLAEPIQQTKPEPKKNNWGRIAGYVGGAFILFLSGMGVASLINRDDPTQPTNTPIVQVYQPEEEVYNPTETSNPVFSPTPTPESEEVLDPTSTEYVPTETLEVILDEPTITQYVPSTSKPTSTQPAPPTSVPPTSTPYPTYTPYPTNTQAPPPTNTAIPPTNTSVPPTNTTTPSGSSKPNLIVSSLSTTYGGGSDLNYNVIFKNNGEASVNLNGVRYMMRLTFDDNFNSSRPRTCFETEIWSNVILNPGQTYTSPHHECDSFVREYIEDNRYLSAFIDSTGVGIISESNENDNIKFKKYR